MLDIELRKDSADCNRLGFWVALIPVVLTPLCLVASDRQQQGYCHQQSPPATPLSKTPARNAWHGRDYIRPKQYVCYQATGQVNVDGNIDEKSWRSAAWTGNFVDIEGDRKRPPRFRTRAKMLWDNEYFYVAAELEEPHIWGTLVAHDSIIYHDNDFEVFIDPNGDNHNYAEYEINALGTGFDLRLPRPYKDGGRADIPWSMPGLRSAVHIEGSLNDPADTDYRWHVELAIPWKVLDGLDGQRTPPRNDDQWRINFSRVQWRHRVIDGMYQKIPREDSPEDNWVWSPQYAVNMHRPETWGYVQFSTAPAGTAKFIADETGPARHLLHQVHYAQKQFHRVRKRWANGLQELGLGHLTHESLARPITISIHNDQWTARTAVHGRDGKTISLQIRQDARVVVD